MFFKLCLALTVAVAIANVTPDTTDKRGRGQGHGQGQVHGQGVGLSEDRKPPGQVKDREGERKDDGHHGNKHDRTTTAASVSGDTGIAPAVYNNGTVDGSHTNATLPGDHVAPSNSSAAAP